MNSLQINAELDLAIRALGDIFISRMPALLADMSVQLQQGEHAPEQLPPWQAIHRQLHSIAGSAGSFGYAELGLNARSLELQLEVHLKKDGMTTLSTRTEFTIAMHEFMRWVTVNYIPSTASG